MRYLLIGFFLIIHTLYAHETGAFHTHGFVIQDPGGNEIHCQRR